jgi:integrase
MARSGIERLKVGDLKTKKPGLLSDGGNLNLRTFVGNNGNISRGWIFRYQLPGKKPRDMGLGSLDSIGLAKARELAKTQAALPYADMPAFMVALRERDGIASLALEFAILTLVRTADVRKAKWEDINRAARMWIIPKLSKTGREHRVPLSDAALVVLAKAQKIARDIGGKVGQSEYIFANDITGAALSENAMLAVLKRMGHKGSATTHGFRSSFRTWAQERTNFPWELAEMSLGHKVGTKVERAYARGDALKK